MLKRFKERVATRRVLQRLKVPPITYYRVVAISRSGRRTILAEPSSQEVAKIVASGACTAPKVRIEEVRGGLTHR